MSVYPVHLRTHQPTNWSELTSLFGKKSKTHLVGLTAFDFIHNHNIYRAQYDSKRERIFINLFDEFSGTYSINYEEIARGPEDSVLINLHLQSLVREDGEALVNALRTSQVRSNSGFDCASRLHSIFPSSLQQPHKSVPCDFASLVSLKEEISTAPSPLSIWVRLNDVLNDRKTFRHQGITWQAWRENRPESGWHIYIDPRNNKCLPIDLCTDTEGNLLVDGVKWDELNTSFEGIHKMGLVCSLHHLVVKDELRINALFAEQQQRAQIASQSFHVIYQEETPDLLGGGDFGTPRTLPALLGEQRQVNKRQVGIASTIGRKKEMEDTELTFSGMIQTQNKKYSIEIYGVYDGHGGVDAALFVKQHLVNYLTHHLINHNPISVTEEGVVKAAKMCYQQLDADYPSLEDGTTALTAFILNGQLWLINTGDSRAIIVKDGKVIQATEDQKPDIPRYKKIIEELGGEIIGRSHKRVKVGNGEIALAVARSIGDKSFIGPSGKCCILPDPEITRFALEDIAGGYLVLACDGLYDNTTTQQIGDAVQAMHEQGYSVEKMAKRLVFSAYNFAYSEDNLTAQVIKL